MRDHHHPIQKKLPAIMNLKEMSVDVEDQYNVSLETPWVKDLLNELEEDNDGETSQMESRLAITLKIALRSPKYYGDYVTIKSHIQCNYSTPCIRCLALTNQSIDVSVNGVFLHESFSTKEEYQELSSYFIENEEMELYYHKKGQVDVKEFIHEQIYIEKEAFPKCQGQCVNPVLF